VFRPVKAPSKQELETLLHRISTRLARVTKVTYDDGSVVEYTYAAAGNRTLVKATKN
jgi:YD repeat-containing protein